MSQSEMVSALDTFPFFKGLPPEVLRKWQKKLNKKFFTKRERLYFPPSCPDVIFFLLSGKVKIAYFSEDGKEFTITILTAGDVYSEHSQAVMTAIEETEVLYLSMADFQLMMDEYPGVARRLVRVLGRILSLNNDLIIDLAFRETSSRLAHAIRRVVFSQTQPLRDEKEFTKVQLTHEELASMSGSTRQTVNEILRHWEQQGILTLHRGYLMLLDPERLWEKIND